VEPILTITGDINGEALRRQAPPHGGGQPPFVLYHEHPHGYGSPRPR
jgi:hypothetical protein